MPGQGLRDIAGACAVPFVALTDTPQSRTSERGRTRDEAASMPKLGVVSRLL